MMLDVATRHELRRLQLLDELRRTRVALEYEPQLDGRGRRRAALSTLIAELEHVEVEALHELRQEGRSC